MLAKCYEAFAHILQTDHMLADIFIMYCGPWVQQNSDLIKWNTVASLPEVGMGLSVWC